MTTLEKLAERVREDAKKNATNDECGVIPCIACDKRPSGSTNCMADRETPCPDTRDKDGALMLTRWAVKLVAEGLGLKNYNGIGVMPECLELNFLKLYAEAEKGGEE